MSDSLAGKENSMLQRSGRLKQQAARLALGGLNLLFPPRCVNCDAELPVPEDEDGHRLCADCRRLLVPEVWPCCPACGAAGEPKGNCPWCRKAPLKFDAVVTLGGYHQGLGRVVQRMKRPVGRSLSLGMGEIFAQRRAEQLGNFRADLIVPIPMFWRRRLHRGANSAEIIAGCLGRYLGLPVRRRLLRRCRNTLPQASLSPSARFRNVRGAFVAESHRHLQAAKVLLVDDTLTTGATCSEAARMLKKAGAGSVACAVIARAQGPRAT